jgi:AGCS family alanine or glycine:cation symporter
MPALDIFYAWIWGPLPYLILGVGIYLTWQLRGIQFTKLRYALSLVMRDEKSDVKGDLSHFEALMTALAATIGIGNIAGVATALSVGGMGALFWMWITALIGMATKYGEAVLAIKYRQEDERGEMSGGPMYFIEHGLGKRWRWLALSFALFGSIAAFGGGNMLQANAVADVMAYSFNIPPLLSGIVLAVLVGLTVVGGVKNIGKMASVLVPLMAFIYIGGASLVLVYFWDRIPAALMAIFEAAWSGQAAVGGFAGASVLTAIQVGASRGLMTSEAGLGTASIAAAAAKSDVPCRQALVSMTGALLATVVMCTVTGLVIGVSGLFGTLDENGRLLTGASMTLRAFEQALPWGGYLVSIGLLFFAFTTLIGWAYYGEKCIEYLAGEHAIPWYRLVFTLIVVPGAVLDLALVWQLSDITNGLMAFPNLIGLIGLSSVIVNETRQFLCLLDQENAVQELKNPS